MTSAAAASDGLAGGGMPSDARAAVPCSGALLDPAQGRTRRCSTAIGGRFHQSYLLITWAVYEHSTKAVATVVGEIKVTEQTEAWLKPTRHLQDSDAHGRAFVARQHGDAHDRYSSMHLPASRDSVQTSGYRRPDH